MITLLVVILLMAGGCQSRHAKESALSNETVVVNAIDAMGNLLQSELVAINTTLTAQTSTLNQAIVNNTTAANAIATAVGLTTNEVRNLIKAINTNDAAALAQMQQQNATLANLTASIGLQFHLGAK